MGVVYKAFDPVLKRHLAIKVISQANAADKEFVARFFREAQATAGLNHPNIVSLYDIGEDKKQPYIAIEYLEGEDLDAVLQSGAALPLDWKLGIAVQLCEGLDHAHQNGVIHRDLKPSNVRIASNGEAKIVDFGVAKLVSSNLTTTGMLMGTPSYMSPEQVSGQQGLDGRSDIFGLGVILYELIVEAKPFPGSDFRTVMMAICNRQHTPLKEILPGCPDDLEALIDRALAKEPEDRFQSASELGTALRNFRARQPEARRILQREISSLSHSIEEIAGELEKPDYLGLFPQSLLRAPRGVDLDQTVISFSSEQDMQNDVGVLLKEHAVLLRHSHRLRELFEKKDRLRDQIAHSLQDLADGHVESSLESTRKLLQDVPESGRARGIIADCQKQLGALQEHEESLAKLSKLLAVTEGEGCSAPDARAVIELASQILKTYPEDTRAASAQHRALQLLEQIRNQIGQLESQTREEVDKSNFKEARDLIIQALVLDPDREPARLLLNQLQSHLESEANRLRARDLFQEALELKSQTQLEASLSKVEEAHNLDPNNTALIKLRERLLPGVEKLRAIADREAQIASLLEEAQRAIGGWRLGSAKVALDEVLSLETDHSEALQLQELWSNRRQTRQKIVGWGLPVLGLLLAVAAFLVFFPSQAPSQSKKYQVQRGDSLQALAARFGTSTEQINIWNSLTFGQILIEGQMLSLGSSAGDLGTLLLEIVPWARIESVEDLESGAMMLEGVATTPLRLRLPPGEYRVTASNPSLGGENMVFQVRIDPGNTTQEHRSWLGFDLEQELDSILGREP